MNYMVHLLVECWFDENCQFFQGAEMVTPNQASQCAIIGK